MDAGYWTELLRPIYRGRRCLIAADVLAAAMPDVEFLEAVGADRPLVLTARPEIGAAALGDRAEVVAVDVPEVADDGQQIMTFVRSFQAALTRLDEDVVAVIDAWDPDRSALVLTDPFFTGDEVAGRSTYGSRREAWLAFEDKTTIDDVWDEAGVLRAPSSVVALDAGTLAAAAVELDWGEGTVWAGDNREGWHGGGEYLRWVRDPTDAAEAFAFFRSTSDAVRIMPFLRGTPCSIHGIVVGTDIITVRPIEMLVFSVPGAAQLRYAGVSSAWDPDPDQRAAMRGIARRVGELLRNTSGYQGVFTIDGVMTDTGFLPSELNPRFGAGLRRTAGVVAGLPLSAIHRALVAGEPLDFRPADLERTLVDGIDAVRSGSAFLQVPEAPPSEVEALLKADADGAEAVNHRAHSNVALRWGPGPGGGALLAHLRDDAADRGSSAMPLVASVFRYAGRTWPITMPELELLPPAR